MMENKRTELCNKIKAELVSERGDMGDSLITIIAIFLAAILMFVFPLMSISERTDDISQLAVQTAITEYVDSIRNTGKMTYDGYEACLSKITNSTRNSYEMEFVIQQLDENPGVKTTQAEATKIGENLYYNKYTSQIVDELEDKGVIILKEGDIVTVTAKNTNTTIAQILRNFLYKVTGDNSYQISAQHSGVVTVNGTRSGN